MEQRSRALTQATLGNSILKVQCFHRSAANQTAQIWQREKSSSSSNSIELFEGGKVARWLETKLVIFFCLRRLNIPIEELISDVDKMEILLHNFTIERKKAKSLEVKTTKILIRTWPFKLVRANSSFPNLNVKGEDVSKMSSVNPHSLRYIKPLSTWALMRFYNSDTLSRWTQWSWVRIDNLSALGHLIIDNLLELTWICMKWSNKYKQILCEKFKIFSSYFLCVKTQKQPSEQYVQPDQTHELALRLLNPGLTKNRIQIQKYLIQIQTKYKTNNNT